MTNQEILEALVQNGKRQQEYKKRHDQQMTAVDKGIKACIRRLLGGGK